MAWHGIQPSGWGRKVLETGNCAADGRTNKRTNERTNRRTNERTNERTASSQRRPGSRQRIAHCVCTPSTMSANRTVMPNEQMCTFGISTLEIILNGEF